MQHDANIPVITLDGPGGSGKGSIACWLAERLGWGVLDSGALYRLLAWCYLQQTSLSHDQFSEQLASFVDVAQVHFKLRVAKPLQVYYGQQLVDSALRTETCAQHASILAALPKVRSFLLDLQRNLRQSPGLIADGRDMGTVIFPDAQLKIFLTASAEARANRRYLQLQSMGQLADLAQLTAELQQRDMRDQQRALASLKPAADAVLLDSSTLSLPQVQQQVWKLVLERKLA